MTRLAVIGDIHAHMSRLDRVVAHIATEQVDGILLVGDLGSHHLGLVRRRTPDRDALYHASIAQVFGCVRALGVPVAWVPGNHDLPELDGAGCVDRGARATLGSLRVAGIGGAGPHRFGFSYEWDEQSIRDREVPPCDVLLCHCPPARTALDRVHRGVHVGSEAIRERALRHRGFLVCGHIHEAPGAEQLGDALCLNAGGLGEPFGRAQLGLLWRDEVGDHAAHLDLETGLRRSWSRVVDG